MKLKELEINALDLSVSHHLEQNKVIIVILDGVQGKAKITEAVPHGFTILETVKGKAVKVKFEESELF